jgi:anaerobic selenocysteine-containing dehydrogenase
MGFTEAYFDQTEEQILDELFAKPGPWLAGVDPARLNAGEPVSLPLPENYKTNFRTPSGKIEIANSAEPVPLPDWFPPYGGAGPFYLVTAPSLYTLNSSFNEQPELVAKKGPMSVRINPADANRRKLRDQQRVIVSNERGEVAFFLKITDAVPPGVLVADGVSWLQDAPGSRTINALTSQRLTDRAHGSTFYDVKVDIRPE